MTRVRSFQALQALQVIQAFLALLLFWLVSPGDARADGGVVRVREAQGPFVVTIFTTPEPKMDTPIDVSVMVQRRDSSEAVLDADVELRFTAPAASVVGPVEQRCGESGGVFPGGKPGRHATPFTAVPATRSQASNKLLYAAPIQLGAVGDWRLEAFIERGSDSVNIACVIPVGSPPRGLIGLIPYLVAPPLLVALFTINQCLRKRTVSSHFRA